MCYHLESPRQTDTRGYLKQSSRTLSVFGFYPSSSPFPSTKLLSVVFISNFGLFSTLQNWHLDPGFPVGCQHSPLTVHGLFSIATSCQESHDLHSFHLLQAQPLTLAFLANVLAWIPSIALRRKQIHSVITGIWW